MFAGQTSMCPIEETINGILVRWLIPPEEIGVMKNKVILTVEKGVVTKIEGEGRDYLFRKWMASWNDEKILGSPYFPWFNPGN